MKNMLKKFLSIALALSLTGVPTGIVNADNTLINIEEDLSTYMSTADLDEGWSNRQTEGATGTISIGANGGYQITQGASTETSSGTSTGFIQRFFKVETKDEENKTVTALSKFQGKYEMTVDYTMELSAAEGGSEPFYYMFFAGIDNENVDVGNDNDIITLRNRPDRVQPYTDTALSNINLNAGNSHTAKVVFDTSAMQAEVTVDGKHGTTNTGTFASDVNYINAFAIGDMKRMGESSYINVNKITLKELESDYNASRTATETVVNSLPKKLASDVDNVTENIDLPDITGVTWSSSNEDAISSTGVVTRGETAETVTLTATVDLNNNGGIYTKSYTMTVPKNDSSHDDPESDLIVIEEDFTHYDSFLTTPNWVKVDSDTAMIDVTDKGIGFLQTKSIPLTSANTVNTTQSPQIYHGIEGNIEEDYENRTAIRLNRFSGNFKLSMDFIANTPAIGIVNGVSISDGYYYMTVGQTDDMDNIRSMSGRSLFMRLKSKNVQAFNDPSASNSSLTNSSGVSSNALAYNSAREFHTLEMEFDMDNAQASVMLDGDESQKLSGTIGITNYINGFTIMGMERMAVGSYIRIRNLKVEYLKEDPKITDGINALKALPESLTADPYSVTQNLTLPESENITWKSSDEDVITSNGTVNRWYSDRDVVMTAVYELGDVLVMKDYTLTVKAIENYDAKEVLNITISSEKDLENWTFIKETDMALGSSSTSDSGLTVTKTADAYDTESEEKNPAYTAENKLYGIVIPYDSTAYSAVYSSGYSGIYNFDFNVTANVNGDVPVRVNIGRTVGEHFAKAVGINITKNAIDAEYVNDAEDTTVRIYTGDTSGKTFAIRFCVDTINRKAWVFVNGKLMTSGLIFDGTGIEYFFDTLRVVIDKNNIINDSVSVNNMVLSRLVENKVAEKEKLLNLSEMLTVSDITSDNPSEIGSILELPDSINGVDLTWTCNSELIDTETGKVYHTDTSNDAVISAWLVGETGITVRKDFHIAVRAASGNEEYTEYLTKKLENIITLQNKNDIRYDLYLPSEYEGMNIVWESSDDSIISNNGKINKNTAITSPVPVTLTANISYNGLNFTKTFEYKISKMSGENTVYSGTELPETFNLNGFSNIILSGDSHTCIKLSQNDCNDGRIVFADSKGNIIIQMVIEQDHCYFDYSGTDYAAYSLPDGESVEVEIHIMPDLNKLAVWINGKRTVDYAEFLTDANNFASITQSGSGINIENVKVTVDDYGALDINLDNIDYFANMSSNVLKGSIDLENNIIMPAIIEWKSSDTGLISDTGIVTTPEMYKIASMTLTIYDEKNAEIFRTVSRDVAIACEESKNLMIGAKLVCSTLSQENHDVKYANDGDLSSSFGASNTQKQPELKIDFGSKVYVNTLYLNEDFSMYDEGIKKYSVSYSNDGSSWTTVKTGEITDISSDIITFDTVNAQYLCFKILECAEKVAYINEIEAYFYASPEEYIKADIDAVNLDLGYGVTENIALPSTGANGTVFSWTSSNPSVITANGIVTRPAKGTNITLTVSASYNGTTYSKNFTVYVVGTNGTGGTVIGGGGSGGSGGGYASGSGNVQTSSVPGFVQTAQNNAADANTAQTDSVFSDVPNTHWAYEAIKTLKDYGIADGDGTGNFNPSSPVTREQFIKMLVESAKIEITDTNTKFDDVDLSMWYAPYISAGINTGLIYGIEPDCFGVGLDIMRCDMAVIMYRTIKQKGIDLEISTEKFADDEAIPEYAKEAVYAIKGAGIIEGYNNVFYPAESLTRAEAAAVLMKFIKLIQ